MAKIADLIKYGEPVGMFLVFKENVPFWCNERISTRIQEFQNNSSEYSISLIHRASLNHLKLTEIQNSATIDCIPTKCAHLLLSKLFFELDNRWERTSGNYHAEVNVSSGKYIFNDFGNLRGGCA